MYLRTGKKSYLYSCVVSIHAFYIRPLSNKTTVLDNSKYLVSFDLLVSQTATGFTALPQYLTFAPVLSLLRRLALPSLPRFGLIKSPSSSYHSFITVAMALVSGLSLSTYRSS
jgi:hypothetical protein